MFTLKHIIHTILFTSYVFISISGFYLWPDSDESDSDYNDPWTTHGSFITLIILTLKLCSFFTLPQCISNHIGLVVYDAFEDDVQLKEKYGLEPRLCLRVVTKGHLPEMVRRNVATNMDTCRRTGLRNFTVEVVTDKFIGFPENQLIRELVVPESYKTKSGALFKARALQYCLEDHVNVLNDEDWIVHLDEETLLSDNAIRGIINFCTDGKHHFGQGVIVYAHDSVVNWMTTLIDAYRISEDMGRMRFYLKYLNKPLCGWKGSYIVSRCGAERLISYDHGPDGSVTEDFFFCFVAQTKCPSLSFGFIEGPMYEQSVFSWWDFIQQRKRWYQGIFLTVKSGVIYWRQKILLACSFYAWSLLPFNLFFGVIGLNYPLPFGLEILANYIGSVNKYLYAFGIYKCLMTRRKRTRLIYCIVIIFIATSFLVPFAYFVESVAVLWGIFGRKHLFYVVQKDKQPNVVNSCRIV